MAFLVEAIGHEQMNAANNLRAAVGIREQVASCRDWGPREALVASGRFILTKPRRSSQRPLKILAGEQARL